MPIAITRILLATDFDSASESVLEATARLAVTLRARVHLLYVLEALMYEAPGMAKEAERIPGLHAEASRKVAAAVARLEARGVSKVSSVIEYGIAQDVIAKEARDSEFDLLVIGSHGRGTTVRDIIRKSAIPVMAVPDDALAHDGGSEKPGSFHHILVPTDFEISADQAIEVATSLAAAFGCKLTVVHAERPPSTSTGSRASSPEFERNAWTTLDARVSRVKAIYPNVDAKLVIGQHWERILEVTKQTGADLIVMGTHGRAGLSRVLLGSVAERVVNMSNVPVLTVSAST